MAAISQRQQISLSCTRAAWFGKLRRHELVESTCGPGGGYSLAQRRRSPRSDIIVAVDEPTDAKWAAAGKTGSWVRLAHDAMTRWSSLNARSST